MVLFVIQSVNLFATFKDAYLYVSGPAFGNQSFTMFLIILLLVWETLFYKFKIFHWAWYKT